MADSIMSKAATMEIPINSNGDTGTLTEDDSLEQVRETPLLPSHRRCPSIESVSFVVVFFHA